MGISPRRSTRLATRHDPTKCTISDGNPCPACSNLIALDVEISFLGGALLNVDLIKKRRMIEMGINDFHDPLFYNFPLEIITQIFSCYVDQTMAPFFLSDWKECDHGPSYAQFVLGGVNKFWRDAVWATPSLWSSIHINLQGRKQPPVQLAREWLSRSGQLPLSVRIDSLGVRTSPALNLLLDLLREYAHRWRILFLAIEPTCYPKLFDGLDRAPALENLQLFSKGQSSADPPFTLHHTPRLREVQLANVYIWKICIQWCTLTNLKVRNLSNEELWSILQLANGLIKCEVSFVDGDKTTVPVLTHPSLQQFIFHGSASDATTLDRLILPALSDFTYDSGTSTALVPIDKCLAFCKNSRVGVTRLTFTGIINEDHITDANFVRLLASLPFITHLSLSIRDSDNDGSRGPLSTTDHFFDALSTLPKKDPTVPPANFLPNLQVLHLTRATISWKAFLHIFDLHEVEIDIAETYLPVDNPTATPAHPRRPLREVRLFFHSGSPVYIEESVLSPLTRVRDSGIQLKIQNKRMDADLFQGSLEFYSQRNGVSTTTAIVKDIYGAATK